MNTKQLLRLITCAAALVLWGSNMQAQLWSEGFEADGEGTTYTSSNTFNDGTSDHFGRTDGSTVSGAYDGSQNGTFFWAGEDWDDNGGDELTLKTLTFNAIDVTGITALQFRGLFATGDPLNGWDDGDILRVEYNMDAAGWTTLMDFTVPVPGGLANQGLHYDSDDDGAGDVPMSGTFQLLTKDIPVTGLSLEMRIFVDGTTVSGNESFAFDLLEVYDNSVVVDGCTNPAADNYDPAANNDDGSCIISGCTNAVALNYNPDANNDDGSCILSVPAIVINEIHYNGDDANGSPDANVEYLEILNVSGSTVDLSDYYFSGVTFTFPASTMIADGEYIVIAIDPTFALFSGATYQLFQFTGALGNSGETVQLIEPVADIVVDEVAYDDGGAWVSEPDGSGPTLSLTDPALDNNDGANWCASDAQDGTPGALNVCAPAAVPGCTNDTATNYDPLATVDDGSCIFPMLSDVVINEIHYNPCTTQGDDGIYEFLELYNNEATAVDISGWSFDGITFTFPASTSIAAGEYIIVAATAATYTGNGYQVFEMDFAGLSNTADNITLFDGALAVVDQVSYDDGAPWPAADGNCNSLELADPSTDNTDPANWQSSFVANGTPGAVNSTMPPATSYTVVELQSEDHTGEIISTNGVVTAVYGASNLFTIQDGTGAYSGIWVSGAGVVLGDEVDVVGQVVESNDNTLINSTMITVLTSGNALPAAELLTTLAINDEQWEGVLISILGTVDNGDVGFGEWSVNDGSGSALVDDLGYVFAPAPDGISFNVVGPSQFTFGNWKLQPRDANDVVRYGCTDIAFPNYDPLAMVDDGSCANIPGCTDPAATNYDPTATADDGSCIVEGCMNDTALNYDPTATVDDGSCYFTEPNLVINELLYNACTEQGDDLVYEYLEIFNADVMAVDLSGFTFSSGPQFTFPEAASIAAGEYIIVAVTAATYTGNGYQVFEFEFGNLGNGGGTIQLDDAFGNVIDLVVYDDAAPWPVEADNGCPTAELIDAATDNNDGANWQASYVDNGTPGAENSTIPTGCTDETASNYDPLALLDDGSCEFLGCTDMAALNYDPLALTDDGSCQYPGCTYEEADNYDMMATNDDGSCTFTLAPCPGDFNEDGIVNAGDLLAFLGFFGTVCP
ncbi:MAG: lamin tail domain-containing protein [Flavobacteriales bacterium]